MRARCSIFSVVLVVLLLSVLPPAFAAQDGTLTIGVQGYPYAAPCEDLKVK